MLKIYSKPDDYDYYIAENDIKKLNKDKLIMTCYYRIQTIVNRKYGNLNDAILQDIIENAGEKVILSINKYIEKRKKVPLWSYLHNQIEWSINRACRVEIKDNLGAKINVIYEAQKVCKMLYDGMSIEEVSVKTGHRINTIISYINICSNIESLENFY